MVSGAGSEREVGVRPGGARCQRGGTREGALGAEEVS